MGEGEREGRREGGREGGREGDSINIDSIEGAEDTLKHM